MKKICFLFLIATLSCSMAKKDKNSSINLNKMENTEIEDNDETDYYLKESDIDTLSTLVNDYLNLNQFKFLDNNQFTKKINSLFLNLNKKDIIIEDHVLFSSMISRFLALDSVLTNFEFIYDKTIYIVKKKQFIFSRPNELSIFLNRNNQEIIKPYLDIMLHRNKYLFNDSKSSFTWLALNDSTFLIDLFVNYGYTADKKLNQWILDNRLNNETIYDFGKAFYYKRFDNTVKFNPEVFEEKVNPKYINELLSLTSCMGFNNDLFGDNLTFEQKSELFARLIYLGEDVVHKNQTVKTNDDYYKTLADYKGLFMGKFISWSSPYPNEFSKYYNEFKRNNFYNLPHFEEYWQAGQSYFEMITPPQREVEEG